LWGAQLIINGGFDSDLSGWTTNGLVSPSSGFALIEEDPGGGDSAIFQTVGASGNPLLLSFELFVDGMSPNVPDGLLPDTACGTVYFGDAGFGMDASAGNFDESLSLFDLDRGGTGSLASSLMLESIATRPGWVRMTVPLSTTRNFVTFVVEEVNLNGTTDSALAVDAVRIDVIPEPATCTLLGFVLATLVVQRRRPCPASLT
jgi:hypothetical protein